MVMYSLTPAGEGLLAAALATVHAAEVEA